jgi:hypothetical protein
MTLSRFDIKLNIDNSKKNRIEQLKTYNDLLKKIIISVAKEQPMKWFRVGF